MRRPPAPEGPVLRLMRSAPERRKRSEPSVARALLADNVKACWRPAAHASSASGDATAGALRRDASTGGCSAGGRDCGLACAAPSAYRVPRARRARSRCLHRNSHEWQPHRPPDPRAGDCFHERGLPSDSSRSALASQPARVGVALRVVPNGRQAVRPRREGDPASLRMSARESGSRATAGRDTQRQHHLPVTKTTPVLAGETEAHDCRAMRRVCGLGSGRSYSFSGP